MSPQQIYLALVVGLFTGVALVLFAASIWVRGGRN